MKTLMIVTLIFCSRFFTACQNNQEKTEEQIKSNSQVKSDVEDQAIAVAQEWLSLIDKGNYSESWDNSASYFKANVEKDQWGSTLEGVRKPLGSIISREVKSTNFRTSLPGTPDGEYVVIQFESSFENKKSAIESVTPMKDPDGNWRVSGYYIK